MPRQLSKTALEQVGLTPCQLFYFFFAAFTGFFAFAFLTIFTMKYTLLLYKFMVVDLSYLPFTISNDRVSSESSTNMVHNTFLQFQISNSILYLRLCKYYFLSLSVVIRDRMNHLGNMDTCMEV